MSQPIHTFTKHSVETYSKTFAFADRLPSGVTVSSAAVSSAIDLLDNTSYATGGSAIVGTPTDDNSTNVTLLFKQGTDGHDYLITLATTLSDSAVLVDQVIMSVRDRRV